MPRFRKKPVEIDALQFWGTPGSADDIFEQFDIPGGKFEPHFDLERGNLLIPTLEGEMRATKGDWIIRGVAGEFYPCKPDIFDLTYESAT